MKANIAIQRLPDEEELLPGLRSVATKHGLSTVCARVSLSRPRISDVLALPRKFCYALIPSFLHIKASKDIQQTRRMSSTAWMDGLRGLAAFAVFNWHLLNMFTDVTKLGFAYDKKHLQPFALPVVRLLHDGHVSVCIFFIISGYVCSAKALRLTTNYKAHELLQSLGGSIFRRWFRLYLPVLCMMFMTAVATYCGLFEFNRETVLRPKQQTPPGRGSYPSLKQFEKLGWQMSFFFKEFCRVADIWYPDRFFPEHDRHLWTIPFEFRTSLFIYVSIIGLSLCRPHVRLAALMLIGVAHLLWLRWEGPLFFFGAALAQYSALETADKEDFSCEQQHLQEKEDNRSRKRQSFIRLIAYVIALYLMSFPPDNFSKPSPGYTWMNQFIPKSYKRKQKFPKSIGSLIFIYLLATTPDPTSSIWHRLFTCRFAQYLGRIMFSIYLTHGPLQQAVGFSMPWRVWRFTGYDTYWKWLMGLSLGWLIVLFLGLWAADVFNREIEARCIKFTKWLEKVSFASE